MNRRGKNHLEIETGDPAGAINAVKEGRAELAVAAIPESGLSGFDTLPVRRTPLVFAASNGTQYESVSGSPHDIVSSFLLFLKILKCYSEEISQNQENLKIARNF